MKRFTTKETLGIAALLSIPFLVYRFTNAYDPHTQDLCRFDLSSPGNREVIMRHLQEDYGSYYQRNLCTVKSVAGLLLSYTLLSQGLSSHDEAYLKACTLLGWYHTYDFFDKIHRDAEEVLRQIDCISGTNKESRTDLAPYQELAQEALKLASLKTKEVRMPPGVGRTPIDVWLEKDYDEVKNEGISLRVLLNRYFASLFVEKGRMCESFTIEVTGEQFRNEMRSIEQITPDSQLFSMKLERDERDLIGTLNGLDLSGFNFSGVNLVEWDLSSAPVIKSPEERDAALKSMEPEERAATEVSMSPDVSPKVRLTALAHMSPEAKEVGLAGMMPEDLAAALASLSPEDMAATLASMSPGIMAKALASMSPKERAEAMISMGPEEREEAMISMSPGIMAAALESMEPMMARRIRGRGYRGAILEDCMFIDCEITKCNLHGAVLSGSRFGRFGEEGVRIGIRNCNFSATTFGDYEGPTTYFQEVEISHTSFKQARLQNTRFTNSPLTNVHFNAASFRDVVFTDPIGPAPMRRTELYECDFTGAFFETTVVFHNVKLINCFFNKATGNKARGFKLVFESCELQNVHFDDADLDAVEFRGSCELKSVFFTNATLGHLYFNYSHASTWCSVFDPSLDLSGAKIFSCRKGSEDASIVDGDLLGFLKRVGCELRAPIEEISAPPAYVDKQSNLFGPAYPSLNMALGDHSTSRSPRRRSTRKSRARQSARRKKLVRSRVKRSKSRARRTPAYGKVPNGVSSRSTSRMRNKKKRPSRRRRKRSRSARRNYI